MSLETELKRLRLRQGITQSELAIRAGISRQALNAVESGIYQPGVQVALKIAQQLGETVERLFGQQETQQLAAAWVDENVAPRCGSHVALARVAGRLVALNQPAVDFKLAPACGVLEQAGQGRVAVNPLRTQNEVDSTLLIAGCDPAVAILADWLRRQHSSVTILALTRSSRAALSALVKRQVHVAGVHLRDPKSGEYNRAPTLGMPGKRKVVLVNFARWELGIATAPGNPLGIRGCEDLSRADLKIANREVGAGARMALDEALAALNLDRRRVAGYKRELCGHLEVASAIAENNADFGVTIRVAAQAYGLGFIPLRTERYDLVIPESEMATAPVRMVLDALNSQRLARELTTLCSYDTTDTGRVMARLA
ncbi:MAG TPA: substrate-binding domain-containing protein [Candidatus Binataceae bacterium]|nr:substrate-binding domain-containing protein [Candidatus Binataceae bacterium]